MLVPFLVDPESLVSTANDPDITRTTSAYQRLIQVWAEGGILAFPEAGVEASSLLAVVQAMPIRYRTPWLAAIRTLRTVSLGLSKSSPEVFKDLSGIQSASPPAKVVFLEDVKAVVFGLHHESACGRCPPCTVELCRVDCAEQSAEIRAAIALKNKTVATGSIPLDTWNSRLRMLSATSRHIAIVDRYCGENYINRADRLSGLKFVLDKLALDGKKHSVHIYTGCSSSSPQAISQSISADFSNWGSVQSAVVHVASDQDFSRIQHGRYIRFEDFVAVIDTGLEIFQGNSSYRASDFTIKNDSPARKVVEAELKLVSTSFKLI
ncbi:hypothetical protein [Methylobacterium sp. Leaf94]|uniref:hypothetical protein n=1 Tax=Methylobacterium sp. Leaf94 TaxID=1736250 RepID=UPI000A6FEC44|nr:hypothetical protein [Methylobacterium sp. Leaf94]